MTVFGANGQALTFDYRVGDVGYIPFAQAGLGAVSLLPASPGLAR
jgi:hypothetical protein